MGTVILVPLILALIGVLPLWPHARSWGYVPSGVVGLVPQIVVLFLTERL